MQRKTEAELKRARVAKTTRTLVRLKHSLAADEELNRVLPDTLAEFDERMAKGSLTDVLVTLDDVIGGH